MKVAAIAGATGLIGGHCLRMLLESPEYGRVISLLRRAGNVKHVKLDERVVDFGAPGLVEADDIFCALGTTIRAAGSQEAFARVDFEYPKILAEAGKTGGAKRFLVVSSVGADPNSRNFYLHTKGRMEAAVLACGYDATWIFRPSLLLGGRSDLRPGEAAARTLMPLLNPLLLGSLRKYRSIDAEDVARAMVRAAQLPTGGGVMEYDGIMGADNSAS